jgi:hypothetical protein
VSEGTLDDRYLEWIYEQIGAVRNRNPARSYWRLTKQLYTIPFYWFVPNDDNRALDGCELRYEFIEDQNLQEEVDPSWIALECSVLEMLVGLARRAAFETYSDPLTWFRIFMRNLELLGYTDAVWNTAIEREVNNTVERLMHRRYRANGVGGLFPLRLPGRDQRKVELWYQLSAYLLEGNYIDNAPPREA